jgi:tetratricopeptide (TPR) repeat protein
MSKVQAKERKNEGNNFFKNKNYPQAIEKYTEAIALDPTDVTFYSNRSACYAALLKWNDAAEDGKQCVLCDKSFVKGYFRAALGLQNLNNLDSALDFIKRGLGIDSSNADLKRMSREIEEAQRLVRVNAAIELAETQMNAKDIGAAYKTIDGALRLAPTDKKLNKLMDVVRPQYEKKEKQRVSGLDTHERMKEAG